jgi:hypothetical protein
LEQDENKITDELKQYLGVYKRERIGWLLADRLHLPLPIIGGIFSFLYFGVLLALHNTAGHPLPTNLSEVFSLPKVSYYYPNLIGMMYDLIGNPLYFVLLVSMRDYIPRQFVQLERDGLIHKTCSHSHSRGFVEKILRNSRFQVVTITIIPLLFTSIFAVIDILVYRPTDIPWQYSIFLSWLGRYAGLAIFIQIAYILLIINSYTLNVKLNLSHPDHCSGLAPFGNLAIMIYAAFFIWAMIEAIGIAAGGSAWEKAITDISGQFALIYLWILFPLAVLYIFDRLVYRPHHAMHELQKNYLETSSQAWSNYHQNVKSEIMTAAKMSQKAIVRKSHHQYADNMELLKTWAKLDKYVADIHTWPISSHTLRLLAIFVNPFVPILIPAAVDIIISKIL